MSDKREYRVKEYNGKFAIQVKAYEKVYKYWPFGCTIQETWFPVDRVSGSTIGLLIAKYGISEFGTLEEAKQQIERWSKKPVFHYIS